MRIILQYQSSNSILENETPYIFCKHIFMKKLTITLLAANENAILDGLKFVLNGVQGAQNGWNETDTYLLKYFIEHIYDEASEKRVYYSSVHGKENS